MENKRKYSVAEFQLDMADFSQEDVDAYETGRNYAFVGSDKAENLVLRENIISNALDINDKDRNLSNKEKALLRLSVVFSDQDKFDDLYYNGFSIEQIAYSFYTTTDDVTMKIIYDSAKNNYLEKEKQLKKNW